MLPGYTGACNIKMNDSGLALQGQLSLVKAVVPTQSLAPRMVAVEMKQVHVIWMAQKKMILFPGESRSFTRFHLSCILQDG